MTGLTIISKINSRVSELKRASISPSSFAFFFPISACLDDTKSRDKMTSHLKIPRNANYFEFLSEVRKKFMNEFGKQGTRLPAMRAFDNPVEHLRFDPRLISLRQPAQDYGKDYLPLKGQISLILDKCYYLPTETTPEEKNNPTIT